VVVVVVAVVVVVVVVSMRRSSSSSGDGSISNIRNSLISIFISSLNLRLDFPNDVWKTRHLYEIRAFTLYSS
jgi:hypothetical protein